ncbi:MAG: HDOD domain-containing protein [Oligoflexales bacterium]|nr:HDOD domain-containing protein [Oligoflexales bacterium]
MSTEFPVKKCLTCGREFKCEQDILNYGSRWRLCSKSNLWFNCSCGSTLMVSKGKFDWYSPEMVLSENARVVFNKLPALSSLPSIPTAVMELQQLIQNENVTSKQLSLALKHEPIISGKILKIANNLKCGDSAEEIESLEHAISYVGLKTMNDIISVAAISGFTTMCRIFDTDQFWDESLLTGRIAEHLARRFCPDIIPDEAYLAGCLCNIGKMVMAICFPEDADMIASGERNLSDLCPWAYGEIIVGKYGVKHTVLGEIGASFWGMPDFAIEAASCHHKKPSSPRASENVDFGELSGFANQLSHWLRLEPFKIDQELLRGFRLKFGFSSDQALEEYVEGIMHLCSEKMFAEERSKDHKKKA